MASVPLTPRAPSPTDAPTTDFALLEAQKENIRPLATGRSAAALGAYFEADDEARKAYELKIEEFQRDIGDAERRDREGEDMVEGVQDVLDLWSKYVSYIVQHNPSSPSRIIPVVESAARRFIDDARYSQDMRYLKLWVIYSRQVERREEVWAFLLSRDIGTRHASFYEEWALVMESLGRKKKADEVYSLGIARRAAPLERLKNRHSAFLARILAQSSDDIPEDDPTLPPPPPRGILGGVGGLQPSAQPTPAGSRGNRAKMEIFSDAAGGRSDPEATQWDDFGTRDGRRKENVIEATPWKGETMPQSASRHRVAPRTPKIEVFKDSGADNGTAVAAGDSLRARGAANEAEMLRFDPLRNFDVGSVNPSLPAAPVAPAAPAPTARPVKKEREGRDKEKERKERHEKRKERSKFVMEPWTCPTGGAEEQDPKTGKTSRRMFDWDAVFKGGEEWSFEEIRARQRGLLGKNYPPVADWERSWHAGGTTSPPAPAPKARPPSPTVNTKLANAEVMSLFNQTIHGGKIQQSDSESSEEDEDEEDEEHQALPTPLPRPRMAMMTPGGMVPPTPCPAPGAGRTASTPNIFADENASQGRIPVFADENAQDENAKMPVFSDENANTQDENASARKRVALAETPAKRPLGLSMRTPLAPTPRAFGDESDPSATPAPSAPVQRNIFALQETIAEEDENSPRVKTASPQPQPQAPTQDEEQEAHSYRTEPRQGDASYATEPGQNEGSYRTEAGGDDVAEEEGDENAPYEERFDEHYETYRDDDQPHRGFRNQMYNRHMLTPVTERTFENTVTTGKSSRHTTAFGITEEEEEEEDEDKSRWHSERERSPSRRSSGRTDADADRSGLVDTGMFGVPEGYTIARKLDDQEPVVRKADTTHGSAYDTSGNNNEFVTAQYGDTAVHKSPVTKMEIFRDTEAKASPKTSPKMSVFADEPAQASPKMRVFADEPEQVPSKELPGAFPTPAKASPVKEQASATPAAPATAPAATPLPAALSEIPNPCNPVDDAVVATLLERIDPPLEQQPLIRRTTDKSGRLSVLQKNSKMLARRSSSASMRQSINPEEAVPLELGGRVYEASQKLGEGGFGAVFLVVDKAKQEELDDAEDFDDEDAAKLAIKVEKPANVWEAVVLSRVHERIETNLASSIIKPRGLYAFADESFLLLDYCKQGTLLDVVNKAQAWNIATMSNGPSVPDEILAIFFTIELLRLVEGLHKAGFVHGDLKIDNCLVRLEPTKDWDMQYSRTGGGGWGAKGVRLIDFGRSADMSLFSAGDAQTFVADWKVDQRDCVEMREGRPWSFEADYFGLASVCYCLLHGKYIGTETVEGPTGPMHKLDAPMKRYWQTDLWNSLFDTLLNPHAVGELPITDKLAAIRTEFETWLEDNCTKNGRNLRQLVKRIENRAAEGRP